MVVGYSKNYQGGPCYLVYSRDHPDGPILRFLYSYLDRYLPPAKSDIDAALAKIKELA